MSDPEFGDEGSDVRGDLVGDFQRREVSGAVQLREIGCRDLRQQVFAQDLRRVDLVVTSGLSTRTGTSIAPTTSAKSSTRPCLGHDRRAASPARELLSWTWRRASSPSPPLVSTRSMLRLMVSGVS
ncbi:hypothetical protein HEP87_57420 [Streptomyces sp. S1D4-11]